MIDIMDDMRSGVVGIRLVDEDGICDEEALCDFADMLEELIINKNITMYDYEGGSVFDYLAQNITEGWTCLASENPSDIMLVGCKPPFFDHFHGDIKVYTIPEVLASWGKHHEEEEMISSSEFESIF